MKQKIKSQDEQTDTTVASENFLLFKNEDTCLWRVSPTCSQGQVRSWLGLHNTSWVEYTSCRPVETGRPGQEGLEGQMKRRGWSEGCRGEETQGGGFPNRSLTQGNPSWRMASLHACTWLVRKVRRSFSVNMSDVVNDYYGHKSNTSWKLYVQEKVLVIVVDLKTNNWQNIKV